MFRILATFLVLTGSMIGYSQEPPNDPEGVFLDKWRVVVRLFSDLNGNGQVDDGEVHDYWAEIDLRNPDTGDMVGYGTVEEFRASNATGEHKNCNQDRYLYYDVKIDDEWEGSVTSAWTVGTDKEDEEKISVEIPVGPEDVHRFYDFHYQYDFDTPVAGGYDKHPFYSDLDFSRNCHGFAYGIDAWVSSGTTILAVGPFEAGSEKVPCWEKAGKADATIAADEVLHGGKEVFGYAHSIKVEGQSEETPVGGMTGTGAGNDATELKEEIVATEEKFRASAVYTRSCDFPNGLNVSDPTCSGDVFEFFRLIN